MNDWRDRSADDQDDAISLQRTLETLWAYRRAMFLSLAGLMVFSAAALLIAYLIAPKERLATLGFRLTFEGAERGEFPNGTTFTPTEIVSTPVLDQVYRANELERYLTFPEFKSSVFVLQANWDLDLISYEYQGKLADTKLSPVDRGRLEEEFRRKRESLRSAENSLNFQRSARALQIPDTLMGKVLQDTLSTWAEQAAGRKGGFRYDIPLVSKNAITKDLLSHEDYAIAIDILRATADRIRQSIATLTELPGASTVRIGDNPQISLADVRVRVEDLIRFRLEPLLGRIRASGLSRDAAGIDRYFERRLAQARVEREEAAQRVSSLQDALRTYLQRGASPSPKVPGTAADSGEAVTHQLSESFLDRLVELTEAASNTDYRQKLTDRIIDEGVKLAQLTRDLEYYQSLTRPSGGGRAPASAELINDVNATSQFAYEEIAIAADQVNSLYQRISQQNLNPNAVLYTATTPVAISTKSALSLRTLLLYFAFTVFVGILVVPLLCLGSAYMRRAASAPKTAGGPAAVTRDTNASRTADV